MDVSAGGLSVVVEKVVSNAELLRAAASTSGEQQVALLGTAAGEGFDCDGNWAETWEV